MYVCMYVFMCLIASYVEKAPHIHAYIQTDLLIHKCSLTRYIYILLGAPYCCHCSPEILSMLVKQISTPLPMISLPKEKGNKRLLLLGTPLTHTGDSLFPPR